MPRLVLINGAPGSGKSTLAHELAQDEPLALALDVDTIKHALGCWRERPDPAGLQARRLALDMTRSHLLSGSSVIVGQYLARPEFIEALAALAHDLSLPFHEFVLDLDAEDLAVRLGQREASPTRPEHQVNNVLVSKDDADRLVASLAWLREKRPAAIWVDARGDLASTLARLRTHLR